MAGTKPFDTIGIVNFVLWVPITLILCLTLLKYQEILQYAKIIINYAAEYKGYFITLIVTIICILISIFLYITSVFDLQQSYAIGEGMQKDCKNIYAIHNTGNYQLYSALQDTSLFGPLNKINLSCMSLYLVIGLTFLTLLFNNWTLRNNFSGISKILFHLYPVIGIFVIFDGLTRLMNDMQIPAYLQSSDIPKSLIIVYVFVLIFYLYQLNSQDKYGKLQPFSVILMVISLVAISLIYITKDSNLKTTALDDYNKLTQCGSSSEPPAQGKENEPLYKSICDDINTIGVKESKELDKLQQFSDIPYPPKTPFTKYLMENIKAIPQWNRTNPPDTEPLWPYVLNDAKGLELNNLDIDQEKNVLQFRKDMSKLRSYTGFSDSLDKLSKYTYILILLLTTILIYPIFNLLYKNDPILITYIVGFTLILLICIGCIIGFISKILN